MNQRNEGRFILALLLPLVAFGLGSGLGIVMGISGDSFMDSTDHNSENTTKEVVIYQANATMIKVPIEDEMVAPETNIENVNIITWNFLLKIV